MENTLVSARVARAKKERANGILASLGVTASDLVNSAYDYVIATKQLPSAPSKETASAKADFASFVQASTLDIDWPHGVSSDYKALQRDWRLEDHEALA